MLKPKSEVRDGATNIKSRIGLEEDCEYIESYLTNIRKCDCILIDEAQFLTSKQVDEFANITDIPIVAFGLKTNFQGRLFEGSKRLTKVADESYISLCWHHYNSKQLGDDNR